MCALYVRTTRESAGKNDLPRSFRYEGPPVLLDQWVEHYARTAQTAAPEDGNVVTVEYLDQIALTQKKCLGENGQRCKDPPPQPEPVN